jgi:hypothetical protein
MTAKGETCPTDPTINKLWQSGQLYDLKGEPDADVSKGVVGGPDIAILSNVL